MIAIDLDAPVNPPEAMVMLAVMVVVFAVVIVSVFASGATFGQLCADTNARGSAEWKACVKEMASG